MGNFDEKELNYKIIIEMICEYKGISKDELFKILKDKELKYIMFLLIKKYDCINYDLIKSDFNIKTDRTVLNNIKKAEENLMFNRKVRKLYFKAESKLQKISNE